MLSVAFMRAGADSGLSLPRIHAQHLRASASPGWKATLRTLREGSLSVTNKRAAAGDPVCLSILRAYVCVCSDWARVCASPGVHHLQAAPGDARAVCHGQRLRLLQDEPPPTSISGGERSGSRPGPAPHRSSDSPRLAQMLLIGTLTVQSGRSSSQNEETTKNSSTWLHSVWVEN